MGSLAILLGVLSISIPFAGIHTAEAKTTENTDKKLKDRKSTRLNSSHQ